MSITDKAKDKLEDAAGGSGSGSTSSDDEVKGGPQEETNPRDAELAGQEPGDAIPGGSKAD